jgi:hypothetical protein
VSDLNNFFSNKRIMTATSIPTEGKFRKGDIIVNIGPNADKDSMWICVEAGSPGVWKTIGEVDLSEYDLKLDEHDTKLEALERGLEEAKQRGNNVKQELTDALYAKGFPVSVNDEENTLEYLINQLDYATFVNRQSAYKINVSAGQTVQLQSETRGCYNLNVTNLSYIKTNWGDGTTDGNLSHTYSTAGTYTLATPYSFAYANGTKDAATMNTLTSVTSLSGAMTNMSNAFANAYNFTGAPVCGSEVKNFSYAYAYCNKTSGPATCGVNVTDMSHAYDSCSALTGTAACGAKVTDMSYAYYNCTKINGTANCSSNNLTNIAYAFWNCNTNLTSNIGSNVTNMAYAFYNCTGLFNVNSTIYVYSKNISNAACCLYGKNAARYLNIYVPANSLTLNSFIVNTANSILGKAMVWSHNSSNKCYYNTTSGYRVKIYYTL